MKSLKQITKKIEKELGGYYGKRIEEMNLRLGASLIDEDEDNCEAYDYTSFVPVAIVKQEDIKKAVDSIKSEFSKNHQITDFYIYGEVIADGEEKDLSCISIK